MDFDPLQSDHKPQVPSHPEATPVLVAEWP